MKFTLGTTGNQDVVVDIDKLLRTRLLVQASSGGGKSWLLRRILEQSFPHIQQIVIDLEGEFSTLREKYDYILVGKGGEIAADPRYAKEIAEKILELGVSAIIDLYELKQYDRIRFVKIFLDGMVNSRKELWRPCLVLIDEAHQFCPEGKESEAASSVIDLCTRGRKRSFAAVIATQRLSKLHKDAAAECLNKLIGGANLDNDRKRAGEELGFTDKSAILGIRDLDPGEFYAYGPAISKIIQKVKVGGVQTTHPDIGRKAPVPPPPREKVRRVLEQLANLPKEAEKKQLTEREYQDRIRQLEADLRRQKAQQPAPTVTREMIESITDRIQKSVREDAKAAVKAWEIRVRHQINELSKQIASFEPIQFNPTDSSVKIGEEYRAIYGGSRGAGKTTAMRTEIHARIRKEIGEDDIKAKLKDGARRMLSVIVQWRFSGINASQLRVQASIGHKNTFSTYKTGLMGLGLIEMRGVLFFPTDKGIQFAGDVPEAPATTEEVLASWLPRFKDGARRMLRYLVEYNGWMSHEDVMEGASIAHRNTYSTYKTQLKSAQLIVERQGEIAANKETLFLP